MKTLLVCLIMCLIAIPGYTGEIGHSDADMIKSATKDTEVKQSKLSGKLTVILKDVTLLELSVKENLLYMLFPDEKIEWELTTGDYISVTINGN